MQLNIISYVYIKIWKCKLIIINSKQINCCLEMVVDQGVDYIRTWENSCGWCFKCSNADQIIYSMSSKSIRTFFNNIICSTSSFYKHKNNSGFILYLNLFHMYVILICIFLAIEMSVILFLFVGVFELKALL
jgi:hypothetical protein